MTLPVTRPVFSPTTQARLHRDVQSILDSRTLVNGPFTAQLEHHEAARLGLPHTVAVNTCTTALLLALQWYDVRGAEVLVPAAAFVTDVSVIVAAGGIPVLVDINPHTLSFDLDDLDRKRTPRTKGLIWIHLTGLISSDAESILAWATQHGLFVIEDCAHAHGATMDGREAGSFGDVSCFSFYATKLVPVGTGGLLATRHDALAQYARAMRQMGKTPDGAVTYLSQDYLLDEWRACVAVAQLEDLPRQLAHRRAVAAQYTGVFQFIAALETLPVPYGNAPSYYHYCLRTASPAHHAALQQALAAQGISTKAIYRPVHQEPAYRQWDTGTCPHTEQTLACMICLPMAADLTPEDVATVCEAVWDATT